MHFSKDFAASLRWEILKKMYVNQKEELPDGINLKNVLIRASDLDVLTGIKLKATDMSGIYVFAKSNVAFNNIQFNGAKFESAVFKFKTETNTCTINGSGCNIFEENSVVLNISYAKAWETMHTGRIQITDYYGNVVSDTKINVSAGDTESQLVLDDIGLGHFTVNVSISGCEGSAWFAVVPKESERRDTSESSIAADGAFSYLVDKSFLDDYINALKMAGISCVRERINFSAICTAANSYNYSYYADYINKLHNEGIDILALVNSTPSFFKGEGKILPQNLFDAYNMIANIAHNDLFKGKIKAWELYNEPDIMTTSIETPDQYAAVLKAMSIGLENADSNAKISTSGFAYKPGNYLEWLARNDIDPYIDIYNMHHHQQASSIEDFPKYQQAAKSHLDFMKKYYMEDKELWLSEAGLYYPLDENAENLTVEQQRVCARYAPISAITSLSQGVDKHFWFIFPYHLENGGNYGSFSVDNTPYSSYSAIAALNNALGNAKYAGVFNGLPQNVTGYVFDDSQSEESVLAVWSDTEQNISIELGVNEAIMIDIMGNEQTVYSEEGVFNISVGKDIKYLRTQSLIASDLYTSKEIRQTKANDALTAEEKIIITQSYSDDASVNAKNNGYRLNRNGEQITVDVYNFNTTEKNGKIKAEAYGGWLFEENETLVTVPARGKVSLTFTLSGETAGDLQVPIIFCGEFDGKKTTDSVALIYPKDRAIIELSQVIDEYKILSKWTKNPPGGTTISESSEEGVIDFNFQMTDNWAYPRLNTGELDLSGTDGLAYEVYFENVPDIIMRTMIVEQDGSTWYTAEGNIIEKLGWQQILMPWSAFTIQTADNDGILDISNIKEIRIGFNTKSSDVTNVSYALKNLGAYCIEDKGLYSEITEVEYNNPDLKIICSNGIIPQKENKVRLYVDGELQEDSSIETNVGFLSGKHTFEIFIEDMSGKVAEKTITNLFSIKGLYAENPVFYDANNNVINEIGKNEYIVAKINVGNILESKQNVMLIAAVYDNSGRLLYVNSKPFTIDGSEEKLLDIVVEEKPLTISITSSSVK